MDEDAYIEGVVAAMDSVDMVLHWMDCHTLLDWLQGTETALLYSVAEMKCFVRNIEEPFVAGLPWNEIEVAQLSNLVDTRLKDL